MYRQAHKDPSQSQVTAVCKDSVALAWKQGPDGPSLCGGVQGAFPPPLYALSKGEGQLQSHCLGSHRAAVYAPGGVQILPKGEGQRQANVSIPPGVGQAQRGN